MKTRILSLILLTVFALAAPAQKNEQNRPPIIDVHVHAYAKDERWTSKVPDPVTGQPITATTEQAHMQATLAEMKKYNIVKGVVSNDYQAVLRWKAASPDHIIASYGFDDPSSVDLAFLRREHAAGRLMALGEIGAQYEGIAPNDPKMEPYWALAEELDIPVGLHTGLAPPNTPYECCPKFRTSLGNPALLEEVLIRHRKLRVYLMHAGYPYLQETIAIMHIYPQVYADLGAIDWLRPREDFHEYLRALMRAGMGKRLMFGSDQMVWPEGIRMAIEGIESASFLTEEQKRDIFYNNAVRFLRLDEKKLEQSSSK
ncbi:MAG: amidohydrolase family protein [Pyrinomonadaceae bacterium]